MKSFSKCLLAPTVDQALSSGKGWDVPPWEVVCSTGRLWTWMGGAGYGGVTAHFIALQIITAWQLLPGSI